MRVANVVVQWIKADLHAIDPSILSYINKFAEKELKKDNFVEISQMIHKELYNTGRFAPFSEKEKERFVLTPPKDIPVFGLLNLQPYEILLCGDSKTIAEQITIMEFDIYSRIGRTELISQKWAKDKSIGQPFLFCCNKYFTSKETKRQNQNVGTMYSSCASAC